MKKSLKQFITVSVAVLLVFNAIAFLIPFNRSAAYWVAYGFTTAGIILAFSTSFYCFKGDLTSKLYKFPLVYLSWIFLIVQVVSGILFMLLSMIPVRVVVLIYVVIYATYIIGLSSANVADEYVANVEQDIKRKTFFVKSLQLEMTEIVNEVSDPELLKSLKELSDDIRFSDAMSSDMLADIETRTLGEVRDLKDLIKKGDIKETPELVSSIRKLLKQRNQQCKLLK